MCTTPKWWGEWDWCQDHDGWYQLQRSRGWTVHVMANHGRHLFHPYSLRPCLLFLREVPKWT